MPVKPPVARLEATSAHWGRTDPHWNVLIRLEVAQEVHTKASEAPKISREPAEPSFSNDHQKRLKRLQALLNPWNMKLWLILS